MFVCDVANKIIEVTIDLKKLILRQLKERIEEDTRLAEQQNHCGDYCAFLKLCNISVS